MITPSLYEVSQLANERGCILKTLRTENTYIYWIENSIFIGKPYRSLEDIALFLQKLPVLPGLKLGDRHLATVQEV